MTPARIALVVVGAVAAVCCAGGGTFVLVRHAQSAQAGATPAPPGLGVPVRDGQFEFVVQSVSCGHATVDRGFLHASAKGQYCVVQLTVANIGRDARQFNDGFQAALGPGGVRYAADTGAGVLANGNGNAVWNVVNPGISLAAKVVYDIPTTATIVALVLHDSALSHGVTVQVTAE